MDDGFVHILGSLQGWGGWAMTAVMIGALAGIWPKLKQIKVSEEANIIGAYAEEVKALRAIVKIARDELQKCHEECEQKCKTLQDQIYAMRDQRIQEQLAFFTAIPASLLTPSILDMITKLRTMRDAEQEPQHG